MLALQMEWGINGRPMTIKITKRTGKQCDFNEDKIRNAVRKALLEVYEGEDPVKLEPVVDKIASSAASSVRMWVDAHGKDSITVEEVQDHVEIAFYSNGYPAAGKAYILYRASKQEARMKTHPDTLMRDYVFISRYSRYDEKLGRRETWEEAVKRVFNMHRSKFKTAKIENREKFDSLMDRTEKAVLDLRLLPSMRSMQYGGPAIKGNNARMYNCAFELITSVRSFSDALWMLLCGCGVGFSVQKQHVAMLPPIARRENLDKSKVVHHTVEDTIEGWADALKALIECYVQGGLIEFNYSKIRPQGTKLKTSGGKAPGHYPLKQCLREVKKILEGAGGRKLKPIECYDILMHAAQAVLSGGCRRSATICLFSYDDEEMMTAKTGDWFKQQPQRSASNNSAVIIRNRCKKEDFDKLFECQKQFGEPGFVFLDDENYGVNPCAEIGINPQFRINNRRELNQLKKAGVTVDCKGQPITVDSVLHGFQVCNLTTINGGKVDSKENFLEICQLASFLGTLQASYTDFSYLGKVSEMITEREALLGVAICGIMDRKDILLDPETLRAGAHEVVSTNELAAGMLGINPAARCTSVKPDGSVSLLFGTGSGIHPRYAKRYFRRVQANKLDPMYQHFKKANPDVCEPSAYGTNGTDDVITFMVEAPDGAVLRSDMNSLEFLEAVKLVQQNWVIPGTANTTHSPGLRHNVSNTVPVKEGDWDKVRDYIWENREYFTGVSLFPDNGDKVYAQAPMEAVVSKEDVARWNAAVYKSVNYSEVLEHTDQTKLKEIVACAGGQCEL